MGSVNKVILVGNLGKDAEVRVTPGGQSVASFSIATTENWTSKEGEKKEQTEWHRIVLWGKTADTLQPYLVKGKQIYLEGRLQTRQWEKEGQKHYTTEVKADKIVLLGGGSVAAAAAAIARWSAAATAATRIRCAIPPRSPTTTFRSRSVVRSQGSGVSLTPDP